MTAYVDDSVDIQQCSGERKATDTISTIMSINMALLLPDRAGERLRLRLLDWLRSELASPLLLLLCGAGDCCGSGQRVA
jgi:hypothetical protein